MEQRHLRNKKQRNPKNTCPRLLSVQRFIFIVRWTQQSCVTPWNTAQPGRFLSVFWLHCSHRFFPKTRKKKRKIKAIKNCGTDHWPWSSITKFFCVKTLQKHKLILESPGTTSRAQKNKKKREKLHCGDVCSMKLSGSSRQQRERERRHTTGSSLRLRAYCT